jgi:cobalt-zinc-cadmium efflux system outer membrane protein
MSFARKLSLLGAALLLVSAPRTAKAEFPTLDRAIQMARARAIIVADAEGELGVANAQMAGARVSILGNPYTEVQVDRPFSDPASGPGGNREIQAMTFNYFPLDIAGQRGKRIDEADRLINWRKLGLVDARAIATGDAVSAYGEVVVGSSRVNAATSGEQTARDEAKYFQGRFEAKDTTLYEKSLAEAEVARWVQSLAEAQVRVASARARFGQVTGTATVDLPPENADVAPPGLRLIWDDARMAQAIDRAPIVQRLQAERSYWEASVERYQRERIPPVSFEIIAGRGGAGEARFGAGAVITFPITRRYQGEIARAEAGRENANKRLTLFRTVLETRIRAARDAIASIKIALDELDRHGIPALETAVTAALEGFKAGKIDLQRTLLARRDLAIARARRLDLIETSWRAYSDLVTLSGDLP